MHGRETQVSTSEITKPVLRLQLKQVSFLLDWAKLRGSGERAFNPIYHEENDHLFFLFVYS